MLVRTTRGLLLSQMVAAFICLPAFADQVVDFDHQIDFSTIRTFAIRNTAMGIDRPETSNSIVITHTTEVIRAALLARGLQETAQGADVLIDWQVRGQGMFIGPGGQARPTSYGQRGDPGGQPLTFIEATLVLDMTQQSSGLLVWRGVLRDKDRDAAEVAKNLSGYATRLLDGYPRRKK